MPSFFQILLFRKPILSFDHYRPSAVTGVFFLIQAGCVVSLNYLTNHDSRYGQRFLYCDIVIGRVVLNVPSRSVYNQRGLSFMYCTSRALLRVARTTDRNLQ